MSASFEVRSSSGSYSVRVETGAFEHYLKTAQSDAIVADRFFEPAIASSGLKAILIEATEAMKSLDATPAFIEQLRKNGANRQTKLVAVGGGIVQDVAAFVASIYMRGLRWSYLPTTVLAMVDSCIGGKSSINVGPYKNLVGTFHSPEQVLIDPALTQTLDEEQEAGGLVEAVKICFCRGDGAFERYLSFAPGTKMSVEGMEQVIVNSLQAKKWFIEVDEFDRKERLLLNFGHTFGHAMEGASHFAISHGIAVGLGILCALEFGRLQGADYSRAPRVQKLEEHLAGLLRMPPDLDEALKKLSLKDVLERFESDKKHGVGHFTLILVAANGKVVLSKIEKSGEARARVEQALYSIVERYARC